MNAPFAARPAVSLAALAPCLIVNPRSFRASRAALAAKAVAVARRYGAPVIEGSDPVEWMPAVEGQLAAGQTRFFILAGDGTVQALVDHLAHRRAEADLPQLLILGGGRTNLIASDLEGRGALLAKLERAYRRYAAGVALPVQTRRLLAVEQAPAPARHGFFVASGLIDDAIRDCHAHRARQSAIGSGHLSTLRYLLLQAWLFLIGRSTLKAPVLNVNAGALGQLHAPTGVLIAATLEHARGWFNPYAARGTGPLRLTAIAAGAPRFWRALPRILRGRFDARLVPESGYLSGRCAQVEITGMQGYSLDGEDFDTDPALPVIIRTAAVVSLLRP